MKLLGISMKGPDALLVAFIGEDGESESDVRELMPMRFTIGTAEYIADESTIATSDQPYWPTNQVAIRSVYRLSTSPADNTPTAHTPSQRP